MLVCLLQVETDRRDGREGRKKVSLSVTGGNRDRTVGGREGWEGKR